MVEHVLTHLENHRARFSTISSNSSPSSSAAPPPLFVGAQGPQGSGKTYLTSRLREALGKKGVRAVVMSLDDLYLTHEGLVQVAGGNLDGSERTGNVLLKGRGLPGTHDVQLGTEVLGALKEINGAVGVDGEGSFNKQGRTIELPSFEKSLFEGEGDRLPRGEGKGTVVSAPPTVDVVVLEGWCVGFYPVSDECLKRRWTGAKQAEGGGGGGWEEGLTESDKASVRGLMGVCEMAGVRMEDVEEVNEKLKAYVDWWQMLDMFLQIKPPEHSPYAIIYKWRLQQEHNMKSRNGGKGMSDEQVKRFVDRYIPGYVFFGDGVTKGLEADVKAEEGKCDNEASVQGALTARRPSWIGRGLVITIGEEREVLGVDSF
ncbi:hypothetical protein SERLADRAFT_463124 [Serpula lacrymans var. lacrymans S7.9]|nr:uncharacterized protein SERLADRAFT_463124 [Serpula lacrymans var. lacrymans S7.9]EGO26260.1 hypothetical protein SERLADRAFT_463124 [Serpula lacrymans var. lacrymans S7.9]